jgi:putative Mg2+ transporter-C (MgtC) family protein
MPPLMNVGDWWTLVVRVLIAAAAGAMVGLDRELHRKPAGLRTHILVSVGACLFAMIPMLLDGTSDSVSRVIQGVAAGIGFLGAGEILRTPATGSSQARVRGLTSAAAIWVSAGLGIAAGCGLWRLTVIGSVATLLALTLAGRIVRPLARRTSIDRSHQAGQGVGNDSSRNDERRP